LIFFSGAFLLVCPPIYNTPNLAQSLTPGPQKYEILSKALIFKHFIFKNKADVSVTRYRQNRRPIRFSYPSHTKRNILSGTIFSPIGSGLGITHRMCRSEFDPETPSGTQLARVTEQKKTAIGFSDCRYERTLICNPPQSFG
jgi:hypothetical protein